MNDLSWPLESKGQIYSKKKKRNLLISLVKMFKVLQIFLSLVISQLIHMRLEFIVLNNGKKERN